MLTCFYTPILPENTKKIKKSEDAVALTLSACLSQAPPLLFPTEPLLETHAADILWFPLLSEIGDNRSFDQKTLRDILCLDRESMLPE